MITPISFLFVISKSYAQVGCSRMLLRRGAWQTEFHDSALAQDKLLHLSGGSHGKTLSELDVARDLLMADLPLTVGTHFLLAQFFASFGDNHGQQFLSKEKIGYAYNLHIGDFGMADKKLLDFARINVLTPANDHILQTTHNLDVAVCIHGSQIARV